MSSLLKRFLDRQRLSKLIVISAHLCVEHLLLRALVAVLPKGELFERERSPAFPLLVSLCEAHGIISAQIGDALRVLNGIRNRCAHQGSYNPDTEDWQRLRTSLKAVATAHPELDAAIFDVDPDADELAALVTVVEVKAKAVGASDLEIG